jgi:hypothetical protein
MGANQCNKAVEISTQAGEITGIRVGSKQYIYLGGQ